jgi:hypothetical protein
MHSSPEYHRKSVAKRCAICNGKFGLIRHYSWRTALCSNKCVDRFKARQKDDLRWYDAFRMPEKHLQSEPPFRITQQALTEVLRSWHEDWNVITSRFK